MTNKIFASGRVRENDRVGDDGGEKTVSPVSHGKGIPGEIKTLASRGCRAKPKFLASFKFLELFD